MRLWVSPAFLFLAVNAMWAVVAKIGNKLDGEHVTECLIRNYLQMRPFDSTSLLILPSFIFSRVPIVFY